MSGGPFPSSQRRLSPFRSPPPTIQQQHMKCTPWEPEPNSSRWKCIEPESSKFKTITAAGLLLFQFPFWVLPPIVPLHRRFLSLRMDVPHPPKTAELNWSNQFLEVSYWQYLGLSLQLLYLLRQFSQFHLEWASLCMPVVTFSCQSWHLQESCSKTMMLLQSVSDALTASLIFHIFAAWRQHSNPDWFCNATLSICWRTACQLTAPAATRRSSRTHANPISWQKVGHWKKRKTQHPFHTPATKNIGLENWCEMLPRCHAKQLQEHLLSPGLTAQCSDRLWGSYSLWRELPNLRAEYPHLIQKRRIKWLHGWGHGALLRGFVPVHHAAIARRLPTREVAKCQGRQMSGLGKSTGGADALTHVQGLAGSPSSTRISAATDGRCWSPGSAATVPTKTKSSQNRGSPPTPSTSQPRGSLSKQSDLLKYHMAGKHDQRLPFFGPSWPHPHTHTGLTWQCLAWPWLSQYLL